MALLEILVLFLAITGYSNAAYCLCEDGVSEQALQKAIDYASAAGGDCSRISQNGSCYQPNTVNDHCSFAVISYYQNKSGSGATSDFSGAATLSSSLPSGTSSSCSFSSSSSSLGPGVPGTTPPASTGSTPTGSIGLTTVLFLKSDSDAAYCLCEDGVSGQVLQKAIDYATAAGADCSRIPQNGSSYEPNTVNNHCSFAVISYYQNKSGSGAATLSSSLPSGTSSSCSFSSSSRIVISPSSITPVVKTRILTQKDTHLRKGSRPTLSSYPSPLDGGISPSSTASESPTASWLASACYSLSVFSWPQFSSSSTCFCIFEFKLLL